MCFLRQQVEKHKSQVSIKPSRSKGSKEKLSKEKLSQERLSQERLTSQQDLPEEKTVKQDEDTNKKPIQQQELIEDEPGREDVADEVKTEEIDGEVSAKSSKKKLEQMPSETSRFDVVSRSLLGWSGISVYVEMMFKIYLLKIAFPP